MSPRLAFVQSHVGAHSSTEELSRQLCASNCFLSKCISYLFDNVYFLKAGGRTLKWTPYWREKTVWVITMGSGWICPVQHQKGGFVRSLAVTELPVTPDRNFTKYFVYINKLQWLYEHLLFTLYGTSAQACNNLISQSCGISTNTM